MTTTYGDNEELVRRSNEGLNEQDATAFAEHHAEDLLVHDAGEDVRDLEAALERERTIRRGFPDLRHAIEDLTAEGDRVACRFAATGTHDGPFRGVDPTGREVTVTGQAFARVADGEIAELRLNYDALGLLGAIGAVETPHE